MHSIAIHVSVIPGQDRGKIEREMLELANRIGFPVTANLNGQFISRIPENKTTPTPDFFGDLFKNG